jgi:hypothetical protein
VGKVLIGFCLFYQFWCSVEKIRITNEFFSFFIVLKYVLVLSLLFNYNGIIVPLMVLKSTLIIITICFLSLLIKNNIYKPLIMI